MYVLEIETNYEAKKVINPKTARLVDKIFTSTLQVMDENEQWHIICNRFVETTKGQKILDKINQAIEEKKPYVCIDM